MDGSVVPLTGDPAIYIQRTGALTLRGTTLAYGYAGKGAAQNDPDSQALANLGPLPCGVYTIHPPVDTKLHGPYVLWLTPDPANTMFGRSGFGIHGDSASHPGQASDGCIVVPFPVRVLLWTSGARRLQVVSGLPPVVPSPSVPVSTET